MLLLSIFCLSGQTSSSRLVIILLLILLEMKYFILSNFIGVYNHVGSGYALLDSVSGYLGGVSDFDLQVGFSESSEQWNLQCYGLCPYTKMDCFES